MKRFHLFEFEDQAWFPSSIRDLMTDYLSHVASLFDFYSPIVPVLQRGVQRSTHQQVVDLATGAGGAWLHLAPKLLELQPGTQIVLTDLFPNHAGLARLAEAMPAAIHFESDPVDAREVPQRLAGLRTQFLSFHHFRPNDARAILQNAVDARQPIAIFEAQKRDLAHLIKFALSPLAVWLLTPGIRPFRWNRLFWTYLLPAVPVFVFWDGLVSVLRTYRREELEQLIAALRDADAFTWEIDEGQAGNGVVIPYLLGYPNQPASNGSLG